MGAVFGLASFIITNAPTWIDAGIKVYDLIEKTRKVIDDNAGPGQDDWNELADRAAELEARINDVSKDA